MVLRPARNETAGIAALFQGFMTQQDTKSSSQGCITAKAAYTAKAVYRINQWLLEGRIVLWIL